MSWRGKPDPWEALKRLALMLVQHTASRTPARALQIALQA